MSQRDTDQLKLHGRKATGTTAKLWPEGLRTGRNSLTMVGVAEGSEKWTNDRDNGPDARSEDDGRCRMTTKRQDDEDA